MTDTTGRLQDIAFSEAQLFHRLIYGFNNRRRGVKGSQGAFSCGVVFFRCQDIFEHRILGMPSSSSFVKGFGNTAPTDISRQDFLLIRCGKSVFLLTSFQDRNRRIVAVETLFFVYLRNLVFGKVKVVSLGHWNFRVQVKGLHLAFLWLLPSRNNGGRSLFNTLKFFIGKVNKVIKGKVLQTSLGHILKTIILLGTDNRTVNKGFNLEVYKVDIRLYFVLIVLGSSVCHIDFGKVRVVRTLVTLKFFSTVFVNNLLCNIKGRFQIRTVDNLNALRRRIKLIDKVVLNSRSVPVLIQNNFHRNAVVVFFLNVLFKLIGTCVFDTLTNTPVRMKIINSADRL